MITVTILGCGPSGGVPSFGDHWGKCDPDNPKNMRTRPSIFISVDGVDLLVDTSPDMRMQLLRNKKDRVGAVLFTHSHADHVHGIDDLRSVNRRQNGPLDVYLNQETFDDLQQRFGYVFAPLKEGAGYYKPVLIPHLIEGGKSFEHEGIPIMPIRQDHGFCETIGYRIGDFAYCTDVVRMDDDQFSLLEGVKTWVIGTLVDQPHYTHADVDKALRWIESIKPDQAYLTHLGAGLDYQALINRLPDHVRPCYDGLVIQIP